MEYEYRVDQPRHGDFPLRILQQERLQNQPVRSHWHNAVELLWVVEGALTLSNDGNEITLPKGSLGIIHSARLHSIAIASERARYHCMIIPRDVIEHEPIFTAPLPFVTRDPVCIQLYCRLLRLEQHRGLFPSQMAVSLLTQLLIELASLGGTQACIIATPMLSAVKEACIISKLTTAKR